MISRYGRTFSLRLPPDLPSVTLASAVCSVAVKLRLPPDLPSVTLRRRRNAAVTPFAADGGGAENGR